MILVSTTTNSEIYNYMCSKYQEYAMAHNDGSLRGFKVIPLYKDDVNDTQNKEQRTES